MDALNDTTPSAVSPLVEMAQENAARSNAARPSGVRAHPAISSLYFPAGKLAGKVALVSGGASGIGQAVAHLFAREGADVVITHLANESEGATETCQLVETVGKRCLVLVVDPRKPEECQAAMDKTIQVMGRLDILVNNAVFVRETRSIEDLTTEQWEESLRLNLDSYFFMTKAALPHLGAGASIINTGALCGFRGARGVLDHAASKGGIHAFTVALASDLAGRRKVRVNCVAPGPVSGVDDEVPLQLGEAPKFATPEEIAPAYVYFASADSSAVSGAILSLSGETSFAP